MMTVMLIRRHLGRSTTTSSSNYHQTTVAHYQLHHHHHHLAQYHQIQHQRQQQQQRASSDCALYPGAGKRLKSAFRMTYYSPTRAMRYYRIWIYTCNAVLFVCVIGFIIVACKIILADPRRTLVPEFNLSHPSLLYAYFALVMQSGFLQLIGCVGARTLNERLLNIYWLLLFFLLVGDIVLGVFWVHHFEFIASQMKPVLKQRFRAEYGTDTDFTDLWNMIQKEDQCCGVDNYEDFYLNNSVRWAGTILNDDTTSRPTVYLPSSCCGGILEVETITAITPEARRNTIFTTASTITVPPLPPIFSTAETIGVTDKVSTDNADVRCSEEMALFYTSGCEKRLLSWFRSSLDILFVLGYCVISFIKLCFLGILRYEIREMIQKIKILQSELKNAAEAQDATSNLGLQKLQQIRRYDHNGSVVGVTQPLLDSCSRNSRGGSILTVNGEDENMEDEMEVSSANSPLLLLEKKDANSNMENKKIEQKSPSPMQFNLSNRQYHLSAFNQDTGNDSDTNSHCALIVPDERTGKIKSEKSSNDTWYCSIYTV